jgi:hypothetical protein
MSILSVYLDGILTNIERKKVSIKKLRLDLKNPRIQYFLDTSLNKDIGQDQIKFALTQSNDQYDKLKENIEANNGIIDPIWILPDGDYYTVIEGNTRSYIYEELSDKYTNNDNWKQIEAYILPQAIDRAQINYIRLEKHLFGQTPWSAYEKAKELYRLYEEEDYTFKRLQSLTKLSMGEIQNNIQAYKDMEDQYLPKYNGPGERLKFSYFVEFRKNAELKKMLKDKRITLTDFCDWVGEGKFGRGEDIRKLPLVLKDEYAKKELINHNFQSALDQLGLMNPAANSRLFEDIAAVIKGLRCIKYSEIDEMRSGLQPGKLNVLKELYNILGKILADMGIAINDK